MEDEAMRDEILIGRIDEIHARLRKEIKALRMKLGATEAAERDLAWEREVIVADLRDKLSMMKRERDAARAKLLGDWEVENLREALETIANGEICRGDVVRELTGYEAAKIAREAITRAEGRTP